jgi:hypothetical protein
MLQEQQIREELFPLLNGHYFESDRTSYFHRDSIALYSSETTFYFTICKRIIDNLL